MNDVVKLFPFVCLHDLAQVRGASLINYQLQIIDSKSPVELVIISSAECSLHLSGPVSQQQHEKRQTTQIITTWKHCVTQINERQCPTVEGNGANLMLLSSWCDASPSITPLPPSLPYLVLSWELHSDSLMSRMYTQWPDASGEPLAHITERDTPPHTHQPFPHPSLLLPTVSCRSSGWVCRSGVSINMTFSRVVFFDDCWTELNQY